MGFYRVFLLALLGYLTGKVATGLRTESSSFQNVNYGDSYTIQDAQPSYLALGSTSNAGFIGKLRPLPFTTTGHSSPAVAQQTRILPVSARYTRQTYETLKASPTAKCEEWEPLTNCSTKPQLHCVKPYDPDLVMRCFNDACGIWSPWTVCNNNVQYRFRPECAGNNVEYRECTQKNYLERRKEEVAARAAEALRRQQAEKERQQEELRKKLAEEREKAEKEERLRQKKEAEEREKAEKEEQLRQKKEAEEREKAEKEEQLRQKKEAEEREKAAREEQLRQQQEAEEREKAEKEERLRQQQEAEEREKAAREEQLRQKKEAEEREKAAREEQLRQKKEAEEREKAEKEEQLRQKKEAEEREKAEKEERLRQQQEAEEREKAAREEQLRQKKEAEEREKAEKEERLRQQQEAEEREKAAREEQLRQQQEAEGEAEARQPLEEEDLNNPTEVDETESGEHLENTEGFLYHREPKYENQYDDEEHLEAEPATEENEHHEEDTSQARRSMAKQASVGLAAVVSVVVGSYVYTKGPSAAANLITGAAEEGFDDGSYMKRDDEDIEAKIQLEENFWAEGDDA
ncbi:kinetoplast-associated protein-like protein [Babesia caballi]|uniref:Kinetoplast-associated protein-like protein n=1 Tax=Babesia caballi TaxID=5871 RepID=A0AAV4LW51_BABCB|nr:kinetoplast-associated protein-like protein [Babesia caballi]